MKKLIMASITAVVVIIVLAGTLVPILDDATETERTFTNEGYYRMSEIGTADSYTLAWSTADADTITVNGTDMDISAFGLAANGAYTFFSIGNGIFRVVANSTGDALSSIQLRWNDNGTITYVSGTSLSATISGGTASVTLGDTTKSITFTDAFVIDPEGDYIMKGSSDSAYVLADSRIYGTGLTGVGTASYLFELDGTVSTIADNISYYELTDSAPELTIANAAVVASEVSEFDDLYSFDKITFTATPAGGTAQTVTYSYVIVPYQVTAEKAVHFTDGENAIFNAIPVMIIIALLLGVVALVLRSRMD